MRIMAFGSTTPGAVQDTGFLHPNAGVNDTSIGTEAWNNPTNAKDDDATYASCQLTPSEISNYLRMSSYATVPGSIIKGIEVRVERTCNDPDMKDYSVHLVKSGVAVGDNKAKATTWGVAEVVTYGGSTDLWGVDWQTSELNDIDFGVAFAAQNHHATWTTTAFIDYIWVKIYYTCYEFGETLMEDEWQSARPAIVTQVGGAAGVFDFFASDNFPPSPVVARKKLAFTATTSALLEDALNTLRTATIAEDRSKLWWLDRDGSTKFWMWAKCTLSKLPDTYRERGRWSKNINAEFTCSEGLWYGATLQTDDNARASGATTFIVRNNGNYPALVYAKVTPASASMTSCQLANATPSLTPTWTFTGTVLVTKDLIVDAGTYIVTNDGTAAYADLGSFGSHVAWMWLAPGLNSLTVTLSTAANLYLEWYDTYIF